MRKKAKALARHRRDRFLGPKLPVYEVVEHERWARDMTSAGLAAIVLKCHLARQTTLDALIVSIPFIRRCLTPDLCVSLRRCQTCRSSNPTGFCRFRMTLLTDHGRRRPSVVPIVGGKIVVDRGTLRANIVELMELSRREALRMNEPRSPPPNSDERLALADDFLSMKGLARCT